LDESALFTKLTSKLKGQDEAMKSMVRVVARHCAKITPERPAVMFAVGPSGVGKTKSAEELPAAIKELIEEQDAYQYLRLDMSEYQEAYRVSQLLGAPQGYVGHNEGSQLVDKLRTNPKTIILFDEIEKAHPTILRALMNAMDAGRISSASADGSGSREIDCRESIFIFTSNTGANSIINEVTSRGAFSNPALTDDICRRNLRSAGIAPEILGRIGRFLVYKPLDENNKIEIITLAVTEVAKEYGVNVQYIEPEVIAAILLSSKGNDFGVRPEKYMIDDMLGGVFASAFKNGHTSNVQITAYPLGYKAGKSLYSAETEEVEPYL
jgi:ATP-dependent Clp protease ATP-binding subunit ClpA